MRWFTLCPTCLWYCIDAAFDDSLDAVVVRYEYHELHDGREGLLTTAPPPRMFSPVQFANWVRTLTHRAVVAKRTESHKSGCCEFSPTIIFYTNINIGNYFDSPEAIQLLPNNCPLT